MYIEMTYFDYKTLPDDKEFTKWKNEVSPNEEDEVLPNEEDEVLPNEGSEIASLFVGPGMVLILAEIYNVPCYKLFVEGLKEGRKNREKTQKIKHVSQPNTHASQHNRQAHQPDTDATKYSLAQQLFNFPPLHKPIRTTDAQRGGTDDDDDKPQCMIRYESSEEVKLCNVHPENFKKQLICAKCAYELYTRNLNTKTKKVWIHSPVNEVDAKSEYERFRECFKEYESADGEKNFNTMTFEEYIPQRNSILRRYLSMYPTSSTSFPFHTSQALTLACQTQTEGQPQAYVTRTSSGVYGSTGFSRAYIRAAMLDLRFEKDGNPNERYTAFLGAYGYLLLYSWVHVDIQRSAPSSMTAALSTFSFSLGYVTGTGLIDKFIPPTLVEGRPFLFVLKSLIKVPLTVLHAVTSTLYWKGRTMGGVDADYGARQHVIMNMYVNAFGSDDFLQYGPEFIHVAAVQLDRALVNLSKKRAWEAPRNYRFPNMVREGPRYLKVPSVFEMVTGRETVFAGNATDLQKENYTLYGHDPSLFNIHNISIRATAAEDSAAEEDSRRRRRFGGGGRAAGILLGMGVTLLCAFAPAFW